MRARVGVQETGVYGGLTWGCGWSDREHQPVAAEREGQRRFSFARRSASHYRRCGEV